MIRILKVLLVEDELADVRWVKGVVAGGRSTSSLDTLLIDLEHVPTLAQALTCLASGGYEAVLLDLNLPDARGPEAVKSVCLAAPDTAVIVLTSQDDEAEGIAAVNAGAEDYLVKGQTDGSNLTRSMRYSIERHRMKQELRGLSLTDGLTGLHNRRGFTTLAEHQLKLAQRSGRHCAIYFVDLDGLKLINDRHGHAEGDRALTAAAEALRSAFRASDVIARIGGDEFAALAPNMPPEPPQAVLSRLAASVEEFNRTSGLPWQLSLSVGVARTSPAGMRTIEDFLNEADRRMYEEKRLRRGAGILGGETSLTRPPSSA